MSLSSEIKAFSMSLGFSSCGIAPVRYLKEEQKNLDSWLNNSYNADMAYMERNKDKRLDPSLLVDGAKSLVVVLLNYFPEKQFLEEGKPIISKYAYGIDYHIVVKQKLFQLLDFIRTKIDGVNGRCFVDSAPVLEHSWAREAGLGWIGKNSLLLNKELGSFSFIGELIIDKEIDIYDNPFTESFCGTCTACIDACPTHAIIEPKVIDARKCISYNTIERKDDIPSELKEKFGDRVYGCDICQDVCPWNKKLKSTTIPEFVANAQILDLSYSDWQNLTKDEFKLISKDSPLQRAGITKIVEKNFSEDKLIKK